VRLSELLSREPMVTFTQVEGFLSDRTLKWGKHRRVQIGRVFRNYYCRQCDDQRTYESGDELYCLGLTDFSVSLDVTLRCPACGAIIETWFLLVSGDDIAGSSPEVRIERYTDNLRDRADRVRDNASQFADLLNRADLAFESGLGAGAMVYLRKIFESITVEVAGIVGIQTKRGNGKPRPFREVLREVNAVRPIIPQVFSSNGYHLYEELSAIIHGDGLEADALQKYKPCLRLVLGVIEEVHRDNVFSRAIDDLGWNVDGLDHLVMVPVAL
jgi:hypothetical protein